jgi:hypothetical protein
VIPSASRYCKSWKFGGRTPDFLCFDTQETTNTCVQPEVSRASTVCCEADLGILITIATTIVESPETFVTSTTFAS